VVLGRWHAEPELAGHPERPGDLLGQDLGDPLAGGPADDVAEDVAEAHGVVADLGARLPPQLGGGHGRAHLVPVAQVLDGGVERDSRHPAVTSTTCSPLR
jgi:hypothetical protein